MSILFRVFYSLFFYLELIVYKVFGRLDSFHFSYKNHCGKGICLEFDKKSTVLLGEKIGLRNFVVLSVRSGAMLSIGEGVFLNNGCNIVVHKCVTIGDNTKFGQNVMVFDHDYDYNVEGGVAAKKYKNADVVIGKNCWIGAGCIILRGTKVGDDSIVGAGCVLKGNYPQGSVIVQKRNTIVVSRNSDK